jgi:hypothetical protein
MAKRTQAAKTTAAPQPISFDPRFAIMHNSERERESMKRSCDAAVRRRLWASTRLLWTYAKEETNETQLDVVKSLGDKRRI